MIAAMVAVVATPAQAGYRLMPAGQAAAVAKSGLTVTPPRAWNRIGARPGRNAESWTIDGSPLNDVTFYGGIADNVTLFREVDKKNAPLPRFSSTMLITDVVALFEATYRVAAGTSLISIDSAEPASMLGASGVRFTYSFTLQGDGVKRMGEAIAAVVGGKLYLISFEAPAIYYFDRDRDAYRALAATATLVSK